MCTDCVAAFADLWPELSDEDRMEFLWQCTAYPIGNNTRQQLEHYLSIYGKDLPAILQASDAELEAAMLENEEAS